MYIYPTNLNFNAKRNLIPLKDYKGPILKLTEKDKEFIEILNKKKAEIELELQSIANRIAKNKKTITREWQHLTIVESKLLGHIDSINREIKNIKVRRLNKQIENTKK